MSVLATLLRQWRRIALVVAALLALIALVLVNMAIQRDIFKLTIAVNGNAVGQALNDTTTEITSVAVKVASKATSEAAKVASKVESGFDGFTEGVGNLFLASAVATPAPEARATSLSPLSASLQRRDFFGSLGDAVNGTMTIHMRPHTTIDLGKLGDIPVLGDILEFVVNLVIQISPLGLLFLLHICVVVFLALYLARLLFRVAGAGASKGPLAPSLAVKLLKALPCIQAQLLFWRILAVVFPIFIIGGLIALLHLAAHLDARIWHAVSTKDYESFLDAFTLDFDKGYAVLAMTAAEGLALAAIALDALECIASLLIRWKGNSKQQAVQQEKEADIRQLQSPIPFPAAPVAVYFPGKAQEKS